MNTGVTKSFNGQILRNVQRFFMALKSPEIESSELVAWFTSVPHPLFNVILETHLDEASVQENIEKMLLIARVKRFPISWWITPTTTPSRMSHHLKNNGFSLIGHFPAMAKDLSHTLYFDENKSDLRIKRIFSREEANPWGDIIGGAFAFNPRDCQAYIDLSFKDREDSPYVFEHYLGFIKEKPVSTGTLFFEKKTGIVGIDNIATPEDTRKQGFATEMVQFLSKRAHVMGHDMVVLWTTSMAESLHVKLGFQKCFDITLFVSS